MAEHVNLEQASDDELARRVRDIMAEMTPLEEALGRLRAQIQQVVSEQKKRERSRHLKARMQVRTTVAQGQMPTLQQVAESSNDLVPPDASLSGLRFFRDSGTEVGVGYATSREPTVWMTNGSSTAGVKTIAEIPRATSRVGTSEPRPIPACASTSRIAGPRKFFRPPMSSFG